MTRWMPKKLFIKSWGCQMNRYDSDRMAELLAPLGFSLHARAQDADMVILNTCHIREKASEKLYSELGRLEKLQAIRRAAGKEMILAVAGCVAQADGHEMVNRAPYVDLVFGPQSYHRLPEMLAKLRRHQGKAVVDVDFPVDEKFDSLPVPDQPSPVSAFVTIQEGCDKFCTFCVVPYTRGAEFSRSASTLLQELGQRIEKGAREITLLGQNVNAWHGDMPDGTKGTLGKLCYFLCEALPKLERLRYTTSHPRDMQQDLIAAHRDLPQMMPWVHLPVQSGSDRILRAMNRRHSADDYRRIIDNLRAARDDMAFSSDFIVGFPGESDKDFAQTLALVNDVGYAQAYSFKYSARAGTPGAGLANSIDEEVKKERLQGLQQLLESQQQAFNKSVEGTILPVLFEKPGRHPNQLVGRTPYMQAVHVESSQAMIGQTEPCQITGLTRFGLKAEIAKASLRQNDSLLVC